MRRWLRMISCGLCLVLWCPISTFADDFSVYVLKKAEIEITTLPGTSVAREGVPLQIRVLNGKSATIASGTVTTKVNMEEKSGSTTFAKSTSKGELTIQPGFSRADAGQIVTFIDTTSGEQLLLDYRLVLTFVKDGREDFIAQNGHRLMFGNDVKDAKMPTPAVRDGRQDLKGYLVGGGTFSFFKAAESGKGNGTFLPFVDVRGVGTLIPRPIKDNFLDADISGWNLYGDIFFGGVAAEKTEAALADATAVALSFQPYWYLGQETVEAFPWRLGLTGKVSLEAFKDQEFHENMQSSYYGGARVENGNDVNVFAEAMLGATEYLPGTRMQLNLSFPASFDFSGKSSLYLTAATNIGLEAGAEDIFNLGFTYFLDLKLLTTMLKK